MSILTEREEENAEAAKELFGIGPLLRYIVTTSDASRRDGPASSLRRVFGSNLPGKIRVRM